MIIPNESPQFKLPGNLLHIDETFFGKVILYERTSPSQSSNSNQLESTQSTQVTEMKSHLKSMEAMESGEIQIIDICADHQKHGRWLGIKNRPGLHQALKLAEQEDCPILAIDRNRFCRGAGIANLARYSNITFVTLADLYATDEDLRVIAQQRTLKFRPETKGGRPSQLNPHFDEIQRMKEDEGWYWSEIVDELKFRTGTHWTKDKAKGIYKRGIQKEQSASSPLD